MAPEAPTRVAGYDLAQIANAAIIADVARAHGFEDRAALFGVMCAMGESSLRNIDYGDWETNGVRNPDGTPTSSIGLFQQQAWWGSPADRMDPIYAAWKFFEAGSRIPMWTSYAPTIAIHKVQINADPNHYAKYEAPARAVLAAIPDLRAKGVIVADPMDIIEVPWQRGMFGRRALIELLDRAGRPRINSMHRVYQDQKDAWDAYRAGRGSPADNPDDPTNYELGHVRGIAADIDATADNVRRLDKVGLVRPFSWESWHWRIAGDVRRWPLLYSLSAVTGGEATPNQGDDDVSYDNDPGLQRRFAEVVTFVNDWNNRIVAFIQAHAEGMTALIKAESDEQIAAANAKIDEARNQLAGWTRDDANAIRAALTGTKNADGTIDSGPILEALKTLPAEVIAALKAAL